MKSQTNASDGAKDVEGWGSRPSEGHNEFRGSPPKLASG